MYSVNYSAVDEPDDPLRSAERRPIIPPFIALLVCDSIGCFSKVKIQTNS